MKVKDFVKGTHNQIFYTIKPENLKLPKEKKQSSIGILCFLCTILIIIFYIIFVSKFLYKKNK
jgi:hypothetical protein